MRKSYSYSTINPVTVSYSANPHYWLNALFVY